MFIVDHFVPTVLLRVLIDDSILSAVDLHAMACEHINNEVLLLWASPDALADVSTLLDHLFLGWIGKVFYVASINVKKSEHGLKLCDVCIN